MTPRNLVAAALVAAIIAIGLGSSEAAERDGGTPVPERVCKIGDVRPFQNRVWDRDRWRRGEPGKAAIRAHRRQLGCARAGHKRAIRNRWDRLRDVYGRYRAFRRVAPYPGGGTHWAIPYYIVYCESGTSGLWSAANPSGAVGPYQLLGWGAPFPVDSWREKMEHHRIAADVWAGGAGASNWVCA